MSIFRKLLIPFLLLVVLAALGITLSRYASLEWLLQNDRWLRNTITARPFSACMTAFVVYLVLSLIPGTAGKSIILGWLFGLVTGVLIVNLALVSASMVSFLVCRHYLQAEVQSRFGLYLRPIQKRMEADGVLFLLTLRLAHAPFTLMNYAAGAGTAVPLRTFWWTTHLGLLPGNIVFVYAGTRLPTLDELAEKGPLHILDWPMVAALAATVVLPWLAKKLIHRGGTARQSAQQLPSDGTQDSAC